MKDLDKLPVACSLTTAELREREATLLAQFRSALLKTEELQEGYAFLVPGDGERIRVVAELIIAERECCPFLVFEVSALSDMGPVTVCVTGPAGTKKFLRSLLGVTGAATAADPKEVSQTSEVGWPQVGFEGQARRKKPYATDLDRRVSTAPSAGSRVPRRRAAS